MAGKTFPAFPAHAQLITILRIWQDAHGSNWYQLSIGSAKGMATNRHQAIIWINVEPDPCHHVKLWTTVNEMDSNCRAIMTLITARVSIQQKLPIVSTHYPQSFNMCIITYGLIFPDNTDCIPTYNESAIMPIHYSDVTMGATASEMTHISTVCSTVCSGAHQRKHQISSSLAFVRRIHQSPVDSLTKG